MTQISRIFTFALALLVLTVTGFAQERERPNRQGGERQQGNRQQGNRQNLSPEEWKKQQVELINKRVEGFIKKMGDAIPEDKVKDVSRLVGQHCVGEFKIRLGMQAAMQKAGNDRDARRKLMTASQDQLKNLTAQTTKAAEGLLDNKAMKSFKKNLEALTPQRGGQGGRGGRGGGGGGGGGGGR